MCTIRWEPALRRLRLAGPCGTEDRAAIEDALAVLDEPAPVLIIDLTAVESLTPDVAGVIIAARDRSADYRINVLRRHGSTVDRVLREMKA
jgi:hypothetical protein